MSSYEKTAQAGGKGKGTLPTRDPDTRSLGATKVETVNKEVRQADVENSRLSVISVRTEVTLDDDSSESGSDSETTTATSAPTEDGRPPERKRRNRNDGPDDDFRLAWIWVQGWRARLRKSGDVVEKARWEWRLDDAMMRRPNAVPVIVARVPGVSALKGAEVRTEVVGEARRKSVHWA